MRPLRVVLDTKWRFVSVGVPIEFAARPAFCNARFLFLVWPTLSGFTPFSFSFSLRFSVAFHRFLIALSVLQPAQHQASQRTSTYFHRKQHAGSVPPRQKLGQRCPTVAEPLVCPNQDLVLILRPGLLRHCRVQVVVPSAEPCKWSACNAKELQPMKLRL